MRDPKHPRQFTEELRRQIVALADSGKPRAEVMREYGLGKSTLDRWIRRVHARGPTAAADNRTPEQNRLIELERENARLRMEVDALRQAAPIFARKRRRWRPTPAATRYRRSAGSWACPAPRTAGCSRIRRARRLKAALERAGIAASGRRICRIMREDGLSSAHSGRAPKGGDRPVQPPSAENAPARSFDGRAPRARVAADPTYVRAGGSWRCVRLLVDLCNRETVGCSCGRREGARLVKAAFSNAALPLAAIEAFHGDRGPEFCDGDVDAPLPAFGIERPVSRPGNPCDNAVVESTSRVLERELVRGRAFPSEDRLRTGLFDWVNRYNDHRLHSTLGCMTPAGFREAGLILS